MEKSTITFDEKIKGWTSFHSFSPDLMTSMNNNFYSFRNGNLYIHNSDDVNRNTFYGAQYPSKVSVMVNESPSEIKELNSVSLEGNNSWNALITAYVSGVDDIIRSSIKSVEFIKKEGIWFAHARRDEDVGHVNSKWTYGIGEVESIVANVVTIKGATPVLSSGDMIVKGSTLGNIGLASNITNSLGKTVVTLNSVIGLSVGDFVIGQKNARVEGGNLRGYTLRIDLDIELNGKVELFAINSEVIKSFS